MSSFRVLSWFAVFSTLTSCSARAELLSVQTVPVDSEIKPHFMNERDVYLSETTNALSLNMESHFKRHVQKAEDYFKDLTEKLNLDLKLNPISIFVHSEQSPESSAYYNTAHTRIQEGAGKSEIHFFPPKLLKRPNEAEVSTRELTETSLREDLSLAAVQIEGDRVAQAFSNRGFDGVNPAQSLTTIGISAALVHAIPALVELGSSLFPEDVYMNSTWVPEVIYREVFQAWMGKNQIRSYGNVFASWVLDRSTLYEEQEGLIQGFDPIFEDFDLPYRMEYEVPGWKQDQYVFSLLKDVERVFGDQPFLGKNVIIQSLTFLPKNPSIRLDLPKAILKATTAAIQKPDQRRARRMKLIEVFQKAGL